MAYTIDDFPVETDNPQIEVTLPVGTHILELVVEDSAGMRSLPDTVVVTVERQEVPDTTITGIEPASGRQGATVNAFISGTNLAEATGVVFYTQISPTRPTRPTIPTLPIPVNVPDSSMTAEITRRSEEGISIRIAISSTAVTGTRTFAVTTPQGVVSSQSLTFTIRGIITPTITIPTITRPTVTIPTLTIPTLTIPTLTRPTVTIPTVTIPTVTRPTVTIPTVTRPTVTIPTVTRPTVTIPTTTIPTVTRPTVTRPTVTIPTVTRPTMTIPTISGPVMMGAVSLTSVKGVGDASADKLKDAGITTVAKLASASPQKVAEILGYQDVSRAKKLVDAAAKLIR